MKALTFTIFLALISSCAFAQDRQVIDSLKHELAVAKHETSRVLIMAELCSRYRTSKPDSALFFGEKGMALAEKIKFPKGMIRNTAEYGIVMRDLGNFPKSMSMQFKALQMAKENNLLEETGTPLYYLGRNFAGLKDSSKALIYYKQAKRIYETYPSSPERLRNTLQSIGSIFFDLNRLDSANYYTQLAYDLSLQRKLGMTVQYYSLFAKIQAKLGKNQIAIDYFHIGVAVTVKNNDLRGNSLITGEFAKFFQTTNQLDSCIYYVKKGLEAAQLIGYKQGIFVNSSLLAEIYETRDAKEALHYYKIANAAKESLFGAGNIQAIQTLIAQEEARQKEIEDAKLAYENQLRQYALLAGLALLLLVAFFLYRNNQKEKKAKNLLQEKNEEINLQKDKAEKTLAQLQSTQAQLIQSEKLASLGELTAGIAHEIQNPLNFVNNFAEVSAEMLVEMDAELDKGDVQEAKAISADLQQNLSKINHHGQRASSIVKGMLEHSRASTGVKEPTNINALADEYLRLAYHGLRAKDNNFNATMETHFDSDLPLVSVIPQDIGRVLLNLINNAFYAVYQRTTTVETLHATSLPYQPTVAISTKRVENAIEIRVQDNGNGIPEAIQDKIFQPFFTTKPTGQGTGLGLSLAYDIVTKGHGGNLEVESMERDGTKFTIQLPAKSKS